MSVTGKRIVDRGGSIGEPRPQKQLVQDDVVTLRFVMDNFRGRSMNWQIGFESPVLKAHGYHWKLFISPSSEGEQWFYLKVGDELREPMLVEATWRFHRGCGHEALKTIGKTQHNGYVTRCSAVAHVDFVANCLETEGSLIIEVDIKIGELRNMDALKEAVMDMFVEEANSVNGSWSKIKESNRNVWELLQASVSWKGK